MYGALWRALPGPAWLRLVFLLLLAAAVVWVCFEWVFPWLSEYLQLNENTVG
jgi:membrane protein implicated in regulation of membrane protease activity